jgi:hypothetical protein
MGAIDHIAVSAATLDEGAAHVNACLGRNVGEGGRHALMGTHNRLLGLGRGEYLEVIAIDPDASRPTHARWFGLDRQAGPPRLANWIVRVRDLEAAIAAHPYAGGIAHLERGGLRWRFTVPADGMPAFEGCFPSLIQWDSEQPSFPDIDLRLVELRLTHPDAASLEAALSRLVDDARLSVTAGAAKLEALVQTPDGPRVLT